MGKTDARRDYKVIYLPLLALILLFMVASLGGIITGYSIFDSRVGDVNLGYSVMILIFIMAVFIIVRMNK